MVDGKHVQSILSGMRVVEVSAFVAAPSCGLTLAQMGADVIRIDDTRGALDYHRWPVTEDNVSLFWCGLNKAKRSVAIDIRNPRGQELAREIICAPGENAGMLLTNFPARGWLDYASLRQKRNDLIQLTIQGDRHGGSAVDYTVNPAVGVPFITGPGDSNDPVNHVLPAWDCITGQMAVAALLAADRRRQHTGNGQHIKLALEDVALATMGNLGFIAEAELGETRARYGNYLFGAFGRDFLCADGARIMVVGLTLKQWTELCKATGLADGMKSLAGRLGLDFNNEGDRFKARREIAQLLETWLREKTFDEVEKAFAGYGVCWGRYQSMHEMLAGLKTDPEPNPMFAVVDQPGVGSYLAPGSPVDFTGQARTDAEAAPAPGRHTEEVLSETLGLGAHEIGALLKADIIAGAS